MESHLVYVRHDTRAKTPAAHATERIVSQSVHGDIDLDVPRDGNGTFAPPLVKKGEKQLQGFNDRIVSLYTRGMATRDIQANFQEIYGVEVSPTFISR